MAGWVFGLGWEKQLEVYESRVCVFVCVFWRGVDQSEEALETVVTAPNPLYQLPSVLTDTASFFQKCFLSEVLPLGRLYVLKTYTFVHFLFFFAHPFYQTKFIRMSYFANSFSFLNVICVTVFKFSYQLQNTSISHFLPRSLMSRNHVSQSFLLCDSLLSHHSRQVITCYQDIAWQLVQLVSFFYIIFYCTLLFNLPAFTGTHKKN